jgi:WD40 repeat protein
LEAHKDIVRLLVVLDQARCPACSAHRLFLLLALSADLLFHAVDRIASASDDGTIMIWNYQTGVQIFALSGHTRPITCLLLLDLHTLISGSSDRTIRISFFTTFFLFFLCHVILS